MSVFTDAWRTIVPPSGDPHGPLSPLLLVLTVVSGLVDGFSYLVLGHIFVANMTGNVLFFAFALAGVPGFSMTASLIALGAFALGAFGAGTLEAHSQAGRGRQLATTALTEAVLAATALALAWSVTDPGTGAARYAIIVLLAMATGAQTGMARHLAVPDLTTTILTTTIATMSFNVRPGGDRDTHIGRGGMAVLSMVAGGVVSATLVLHGRRVLDLLFTTVLLASVATVAGRLSASGPAWDRR